jgi:16S rRNA processing protein RimM
VIRVGQVTGAFGLQGAVKVLPLTDFEDRFGSGASLYLDGRPCAVAWAERRPAGLVVKLAGVDDRDRASSLRGLYLEIPAADSRPLPEGSFYHHQLVGLEVETGSGRSLGRLVDVLPLPANDVWVAAGPGGERLLPATREAVLEVDLEKGRVRVADWLVEADDV